MGLNSPWIMPILNTRHVQQMQEFASLLPLRRRRSIRPWPDGLRGAISRKSDEAIIADLAALAEAHTRLVQEPEGSSFSMDVCDGRWLSSVLDVHAIDHPGEADLQTISFGRLVGR